MLRRFRADSEREPTTIAEPQIVVTIRKTMIRSARVRVPSGLRLPRPERRDG